MTAEPCPACHCDDRTGRYRLYCSDAAVYSKSDVAWLVAAARADALLAVQGRIRERAETYRNLLSVLADTQAWLAALSPTSGELLRRVEVHRMFVAGVEAAGQDVAHLLHDAEIEYRQLRSGQDG